MTSPRPPGQIITFYSYKGGTGRTMLLANVAWVLASNGLRVLVVDWDLEAPGLHRYLHPFLVDPELSGTEGVIDFVTDYAMRAMTPGTKEPEAWRSHADLSRYAVSLEHDGLPPDATLDFAPAGRQGDAYAVHVNSFNWQDFYGRLGGGAFLEEVKERLRADYDYVLIDSRTGVSDTAGICTVQLPDALVVCFTLNNQSIEGAAAVAESVSNQRQLRVYPVPTRIEFAEKQKLDLARSRAHERFDTFLSHLDGDAKEAYWGGVEVIYQPFYAYEEVLATFADRPGQANSLLAAVERLTGYLTGGEVQRLVPPAAAERDRVLASFSGLAAVTSDATEEVAKLARKLEAKEQEVASLAAETQRTRRRSRTMAIAAALATVLAAGVLWFVTQGGDDPPAGEARLDAHGEPHALDFGATGDQLVEKVSVVADEVGPMHVHSVTIEGSEDFVVYEDGCSDTYISVTPDDTGDPVSTASCIIEVAFEPGRGGEGEGPRTATLQVAGGTDEVDDTLEIELAGCKKTCEESE